MRVSVGVKHRIWQSVSASMGRLNVAVTPQFEFALQKALGGKHNNEIVKSSNNSRKNAHSIK